MPDRQAAISAVAAHNAKEPRNMRVLIGIGAVVVAAAALLFWLYLQESQQLAVVVDQSAGQARDLTAVQAAQQDAAGKSQALADQVRGLGQTPVVAPAVPDAGPAGPVGPAGAAGGAGRGIVGTSQIGGHLLVAYTDGSTVDVGQITGPPGAVGATGATGVSGVSVTATQIVGGHLVVTYSNGASSDVGQIVGPAGANGTAGSAGAAGPAGPPSPPGHIVEHYADGTTSTCTRDSGNPGKDSAPNYTCPAPATPTKAGG